MRRGVLHNCSLDVHVYMHVFMYVCTSTTSYQPLNLVVALGVGTLSIFLIRIDSKAWKE